jgi:hypothetical protein
LRNQPVALTKRMASSNLKVVQIEIVTGDFVEVKKTSLQGGSESNNRFLFFRDHVCEWVGGSGRCLRVEWHRIKRGNFL